MRVKLECLEPQMRFLKALNDPAIRAIFYGGARGGGKSYISRAAMVVRRLQFPGTKGLLLRRTIDELKANHVGQMHSLLRGWGYVEGKDYQYLVNAKIFRFPGESEIWLGYLQKRAHLGRYQGQAFMDIAFDELTQFEEFLWTSMVGSCRMDVKLPGAYPKMWGTGNPGGIGQAHVKRRFVDPHSRAPGHAFVQASLWDNTFQLDQDPEYGLRMAEALPEWQRRQWLDGDWDTVEGAYFNIPASMQAPQLVPFHAHWYSSADPGYYPDPFGCLWIAEWMDSSGNKHSHVTNEIKENRLELDEQAQAAMEIERSLPGPVRARLCDPIAKKRIESESDVMGKTTLRVWRKNGFACIPVKRRARVPGWSLLRILMRDGVLTVDPSCKALYEELRSAYHEELADGSRGTDIDGDCSDHLLDCLRYYVGHRYGLEYVKARRSAYQDNNLQLVA